MNKGKVGAVGHDHYMPWAMIDTMLSEVRHRSSLGLMAIIISAVDEPTANSKCLCSVSVYRELDRIVHLASFLRIRGKAPRILRTTTSLSLQCGVWG